MIKDKLIEPFKILFSLKTWLAVSFLFGLNGLIALLINFIALSVGYELSISVFLMAWQSACLSSIFWIALVVWSQKKEKQDAIQKK